MQNTNVFKRTELKFMLRESQVQRLLGVMEPHMEADRYGRSTIQSLYYDTPDYRLIRRSIEKPKYKEKLRVRSYGIAMPESEVFIELKKKYDSVVYKRRIAMKQQEAQEYLAGKKPESCPDTQILREIDYFRQFYRELAPAMLISYEREAFFGKEDPDFRITFDRSLLWRTEALSLCAGIYGKALCEAETVLMEVKTKAAMPLWLVQLLGKEKIYKTSFSKYGTAYRSMYGRERKSEENPAELCKPCRGIA